VLALVFLGFLNLGRGRSDDPYFWWLCLIANLLGSTFYVTIAVVVAEPQAYLVVGLAAAALLASLPTAHLTSAAR
jgi:hypothetical protein